LALSVLLLSLMKIPSVVLCNHELIRFIELVVFVVIVLSSFLGGPACGASGHLEKKIAGNEG